MLYIERKGDSAILHVWQELDIGTRDAFSAALRTLCAVPVPRLVVSFERCDYCDSGALNLLLGTSERVGAALTVVVPPDNASRRVFEICRIPVLMRVTGSLREAVGNTEPASRRANGRRHSTRWTGSLARESW